MTLKYNNYKDSGVQWLGMIPGHWKTVALKRVSNLREEKKLQEEIEHIKEYKQRLISDVVTGQIKVC